MFTRVFIVWAVLIFPLAACQHQDAHRKAFADAHVHYNWDQKEIVSAAEIHNILQRHHVGLTLIAATPTVLALELAEQDALKIIPIFSPYTHELGKRDWYKNQALPELFEEGIRQHHYFGLGEVHFMAGFPPRLDNPVFEKLLSIAKRYQVPSLIHIDSADEQLFLELCRKHPDQLLIFAHAGGNLKAQHLESIMRECPNAWVDFAARDPWRYGGLVDSKGKLLPSWRSLMLTYSDRILTGTDPVWRVTRTQSWDQADDGWNHYQQLYQFHMHWLAQLPEKVARKIRWDNLNRLFSNRLSLHQSEKVP